MDLAGSLSKAIEIVKLNGSAAAEVGRDEQALPPGMMFVAVGGLAGGIAALFRHGSILGLITMPIISVVVYLVGVAILHLVATLAFGGKGEYIALLRAESHAAIISWAGIIPFLGLLVGLWHFPVSVVILQSLYGLPRDKAIATVAVIAGFFLLLGMGMIFVLGAAVFLGAG